LYAGIKPVIAVVSSTQVFCEPATSVAGLALHPATDVAGSPGAIRRISRKHPLGRGEKQKTRRVFPAGLVLSLRDYQRHTGRPRQPGQTGALYAL
jgi:hypothetical protein